MQNYRFFVPTGVLFGAGMLNELHAQKMPGKKALICISSGKSTRANGYLTRTEHELDAAGAAHEVFDGIGANPTREAVMEGAQAARACGADFIVALGGGSVMDAAKGIALMASNPGDVWDYVGGRTGGGKQPEHEALPIIAVTTTAGTGSEVDCGGVISNLETNEKIGLVHPSLYPTLAIVDPELMLTVSPKFTAYQGFDALFHSVEGYIAKPTSPMSDMVQRAAIEHIGRYLARAVHDGSDLEARTGTAFANTMSGYSMMIGACTSQHSMEHAMSAYHPELPHGAGLIMLSKEYFSYWIDRHVCDERFVDLARFLGKPDAARPEDFITMLVALQKDCGVDQLNPADYGLTAEESETLARNARETMGGLFACDPADMPHEDCAAIFRRVLTRA